MKLSTPLSLLALALALGAAPSSADPLTARMADGLALLASPTARVLELPGGARVDLASAVDTRWNALEARDGRWWLTGTTRPEGDAAARLVVLGGKVDGQSGDLDIVDGPVVRSPRMLSEPRLLVDAAGWTGLAWIEGDGPKRQRVMAARRVDGVWDVPSTISPPGAGSQLALTTTSLDDGTFLLAWSSFDGEDDEILWSRWDGQHATPPARVALDNAVPDITPHVLAAPGGVWLTWSRYDGRSYRVVVARFQGESFAEPLEIGPRGSLYPTLEEVDGRLVVVFQTASTRGWTAAELGGDGEVLRKTETEAASDARPVVEGFGAEGLKMHFVEAPPTR